MVVLFVVIVAAFVVEFLVLFCCNFVVGIV